MTNEHSALFRGERDFYRIRRLPPYIFEEVNRLKASARAAGVDVIDFGMGNPDMPPARHIIDKLIETAPKPRVHRYSASRGIAGLRRACAAYYGRRFNVELDPETEIIATLGSKEGLANMAQAMTAPGDIILAPSPAYPIHTFGFILAGAEITHVPLPAGENFADSFLASIDAAARQAPRPPLALVINFPGNPTAQMVSLDFYEEIIRLARRYEFFVLSDIAYAEIYYDTPPPSLLQVRGAKEIAVEFSSLSKTFAMPGWRIGFAAGQQRLIHALRRIKSYVDYGAFTPVQVAAAAALNGPESAIEDIRAIYRRRRNALITSMRLAGWDIPSPPATMFAWAKVPKPFAALGSLEFSKLLLEKAEIAVAPGIGFGEHGKDYVRISLAENVQRIRQAARNYRRFAAEYGGAEMQRAS